MRRLLAVLLLMLLPGGVMVCRAATTPEEVEEDHSLATSLVTPHKAWGRGHVGGPIRALFFVLSGHYGSDWGEPGTRLREVVELAQRFDIEADAVWFAHRGDVWSFHAGQMGQDRAERLLARPYDLYVIAGFPFERLPGKTQYQILERVVAGAGLICCNDAPSEYLTAKRQITPTPQALVAGLPAIPTGPELAPQLPEKVVTAYQLRGGRAVRLAYPAFALTPTGNFSWRGLVDYDYRMLLVGRAALWAARREGAVEVTAVQGAVALAEPGAEAAGGAQVTLATAGDRPVEVTLELELRRPSDGESWELPAQRVTVAADRGATVAVTLPRVRAGEYYLDVIARSARGVEACGAGNVLVTSDYGVEAVSLDRSFVEAGEAISGTATLRGQPPAGSILRLRFRDSYGRNVAQQDLPVNPGQTAYGFEYAPDPNATIEIRVEAVLLSEGEEVEMAQSYFTVPKRRQGRMNFVQWDTPRDVLGFYQWEVLKRAGWQVALLGSMGGVTQQPPALRASDISIVPYSTRILDPKDENGFMEPVCWNDEPAVDEHVQRIVDNQALLREQGVFVYSLGDEGVTKGCCVHPACIEAYRRWLQQQYGTIEALNASWGESYASFDQVDLLDRNDNMELASQQSCPPRWYDRQAFARWNLSHFVSRFVDAYARLDPHALTGYEGTGGFGDDYDAICTTNTFYGPYPSIGDDIVRSIYPRERVRSNWMGYSKTADALSDAAWRMVMKGMDSIWWWMWDGFGSWRGYVRPTMDLWPATAEVTEEMRPVQRGLGDLLLSSEVAYSGIAVFYSVPSALAGGLEAANTFTRPQAVHEAWTELTYELGLDLRYLTRRLLIGGELDTDEFSVLLLPFTQAIGPDEAEAIGRFVAEGGTVIADVRPGVFDAHCRALEPGALDELFGITRIGRGAATTAAVSLSAELGGRQIDVDLGEVPVDADVRPASARALAQAGEAPLLLVNEVGRGRAVLLNFQLPASRDDEAVATAARELLGALYELGGARAPIAVSAPDGGGLPFSETRVWRNGVALGFGSYRKVRCAWFGPTSGT
ncbi:MAG: beta-galactosidase, partial [Armatimonadota bacterium]